MQSNSCSGFFQSLRIPGGWGSQISDNRSINIVRLSALCSGQCCYLLLDQVAVPFALCAVLSSWWWTEKPSETCRGSYRNKLRNVASCWLYPAIILAMHGPHHHHHHHHHHVHEVLVHVSCSLILKMKLVPPSLPRSSYVSSSFWFILYNTYCF